MNLHEKTVTENSRLYEIQFMQISKPFESNFQFPKNKNNFLTTFKMLKRHDNFSSEAMRLQQVQT